MKTYVAFLDCPNGHNLLAGSFEAEGDGDGAAFDKHFRWMSGEYEKEVAAGTMPPACPFCNAPQDNFVIYAKESKVSGEEIRARMRADEAANLERARQAMRRKLN